MNENYFILTFVAITNVVVSVSGDQTQRILTFVCWELKIRKLQGSLDYTKIRHIEELKCIDTFG